MFISKKTTRIIIIGWVLVLAISKTTADAITDCKLVSGKVTATFNSLGLAVKYEGKPKNTEECKVKLRPNGSEKWQQGINLVLCADDKEFRGSLLNLQPGTTYEIEVNIKDSNVSKLSLKGQTWPEKVTIGTTKQLPKNSNEPLVISDQGKPDAWILYTGPEGQSCSLDAGKKAVYAVFFDKAAYVIFRNIKVRGGKKHAIGIDNSNHIRIQRCDIADWGDPGTIDKKLLENKTMKRGKLLPGLYVDKNGKVINQQAGVAVSNNSSQVVIEDNFIHNPRGTANSWKYGHPNGPNAVNLAKTGGNNVIRNNDMIGNETHWWNDGIEGRPNKAVNGGPSHDTDLYGNIIAFSNDDGTELDGGQLNVRFWNNWIDKALCGVSCAPNRKGPSYVFRNLIVLTGEERFWSGAGFKMGGNRFPNSGLSMLFHNTVFTHLHGLTSGHYGKGPTPIITRNNIFTGPGKGYGYIRYRFKEKGDFDYDLIPKVGIYGLDPLLPKWEKHAVKGQPEFVNDQTGDFRLKTGSKGIDAGLLIPNINDDYSGKAPDLGAFESGSTKDASFPIRSSGMSALPLHSIADYTIGKEKPQLEIKLKIPEKLGSTWQAYPNSPWMKCVPDSGNCNTEEQTVTVTLSYTALEGRKYRGAVTFRTNQGFNRSVMVDFNIHPATPVSIVQEAEDGTISGPFVPCHGNNASGGIYLADFGEKSNQKAKVDLEFEIPEDGIYYLKARCMIPGPIADSGKKNSFFFAIDNGKREIWDILQFPNDTWRWEIARSRFNGQDPYQLKFSKGKHMLTIYSREPEARLDKIIISNDALLPTISPKLSKQRSDIITLKTKALEPGEEQVITIPPPGANSPQGMLNFTFQVKDTIGLGKNFPAQKILNFKLDDFAKCCLKLTGIPGKKRRELILIWQGKEFFKFFRSYFMTFQPGKDYNLTLTWDIPKGSMNLYLNGYPLSKENEPAVAGKTTFKNIKLSGTALLKQIKFSDNFKGDKQIAEMLGVKDQTIPPLEIGQNFKELQFLAPETEVVYENSLGSEKKLKGWVMEGPGKAEIKDAWLELVPPSDIPKGHFTYWCPEDLPENYLLEWEFKTLNNKGLNILFIDAKGLNGEDILTGGLKPRDGSFKQYWKGDFRSYHFSYLDNGEWIRVNKNPFKLLFCIGKRPRYQTGQINKMVVLKKGNRITFAINGLVCFDAEDKPELFGPSLHGGKFGFRQMVPSHCAYRNVKISKIK